MAAIRSHFISLFSGGIFPDRKWWLSCFCLPHNREEKPVRQPRPTERAIYTIPTSLDEEPDTEFKSFSGLEGISIVHEEDESHLSGGMASEAPLANGFRMQLLNSLSFNNHLRGATVNFTEDQHIKVDAVDDVVLGTEERSSYIFPDSALSHDNAVEAIETEAPFTDIQCSTADNDREIGFPDVHTCTGGLTGDPPFASCLVSCSPIFVDLEESQSSPRRNIQPMNTSREIRESEVELVNEALLGSNDDAKGQLNYTTDLDSTCFSDDSLKLSSNQETSGIQSNLSSLEGASVHLSSCSGNGTIMHTSDEDSEPGFQFDIQPPFFHADCLEDSTSHGAPHTPISSCLIGEIPAMSRCDDGQEMKKSNSANDVVLSETLEKPFNEGSCLELCNGTTEQEILLDNHIHGAAEQVALPYNSLNQQRLPLEVGREESDALFKSKCNVTEDCAVSDQLMQHGMISVMNTIWPVDPDACLTTEQSCDKAEQAELIMTFTGIARDSVDSVELVNRSTIGNAESTVIQETGMTDDSSECLNGDHYIAWHNCGVKDEEMDAFDENMRLHSLLQMKLLFRPDSYETLERLVDDETVLLLGKALDEVFSVRRYRETLLSHGRKGLGNFQREVTADDIKTENGMLHCDELSPIGYRDPFSLSKSNVFQEIVIENFEQLFDSEEWLDDDFGFSSASKSEFQQIPYCDRIQQAREAFHHHDFELLKDDDYPSSDVQLPVIQLTPETVFPLVDEATDIFWSRRRYGEPVSAVCPPETYFTVEDHSDNVDSYSQRSHETFVFHLVAEILQEIYSDELTEVPEPWQRVYNFKPKFTENPPTTVDVLRPILHSRVLQWLKFEKGYSHEMTRKSTGLSKQLDKKDIVDRLLITEMYQEEPSWTDYNQDANMIKNRVANKLFISLIDDTVQAFKFIQCNALTNKCQ